MTTITFKNEHGEYSITVNEEEMDLFSVAQSLVRPIFRAAGYAEESIVSQFGADEF